MIPNGMETKYPAIRPQIIGMSFRVPRASRKIKMVVVRDIAAISRPTFSGMRYAGFDLPRAMETATGASMSPMTIIIGPMTIGGNSV